jgi:hypothetical protein
VDWSRNWLDPRIDPRVVATLASRNINVRTKGLVDTGLGTLARVESQKAGIAGRIEVRAVHSPLPYVVDPFGFGFLRD